MLAFDDPEELVIGDRPELVWRGLGGCEDTGGEEDEAAGVHFGVRCRLDSTTKRVYMVYELDAGIDRNRGKKEREGGRGGPFTYIARHMTARIHAFEGACAVKFRFLSH